MAHRAHLRTLKILASAVAVALLGGLLAPASGASASVNTGWLTTGSDPARVLQAVSSHNDKLPLEFSERLQYAQPDGTLRVMVALGGRNPSIDRFVEANTTAVKWYSASPSFYATVTPKQLAVLLEAAFVTFVEPDYPITHTLAISVPEAKARGTAGAPGVWSFDKSAGTRGALRSDVAGLDVNQATGKGVTVAVVDSGIDKTHRDFGGWNCEHTNPYEPCESRVTRTVTAEHIVGPGFDFGDDLPTTDLVSGHGTHVAGIVGGNAYYVRDGGADGQAFAQDLHGGDGFTFGVAPQASLMNVKNGDSQWAGLGSFGLDWLATNAGRYGVRVANNSWGCPGGCTFNGNSATNQTYKALYNAGVVVTFAAGNDGGTNNGTALNGSSQSPYVLGVASYDATNRQLASSSSRGSSAAALPDAASWTPASEPVNGHRRPDVAAPGVSIYSAANLTGGTSAGIPRQSTADIEGGFGCCFDEYRVMGGTSMATPHVSGAAALLFSACPTATTLDAMRAIMVGANKTRVLKTASTTVAQPFEVGYGGLDVKASLTWLISQPACDTGPPNTAPVANDDSLSLNQGVAGTVDVLGNDSDADGDELSVVSTTDATSGTISVTSDGVSYTPDDGFFGTDSFSYVVGDGRGGTDTGLVSIVVNGRPTAVDDSVATNQGQAVTFSPLANDSDPEGDEFSISGTSGPAHGSVSVGADGVTYTPQAGFYGVDTFEYEIADSKGAGDTGLVSVNVNGAPVATNDSVATNQGRAVTFSPLANDSDPEGDEVSISSTGGPKHGSATIGSSGITYTPNASFYGTDSFEYEITDAKGARDTGLVTVSVNGAPVAKDDSASTRKKDAVRINVVANDSDPEGAAISIASASQGAQGSVDCSPTGTCTYVPNGKYRGADSFTYVVCDALGACSQATTRIQVS